jgi:hypothetical protein
MSDCEQHQLGDRQISREPVGKRRANREAGRTQREHAEDDQDTPHTVMNELHPVVLVALYRSAG